MSKTPPFTIRKSKRAARSADARAADSPPTDAPPRPAVKSESLLIPIALLVALTLITFGAVARFDFVSWDDDIHVFNNPYLSQGMSGLAHFWTNQYQYLYIPVAYTIFMGVASAAHTVPGMMPVSALTPEYDPHVFHLFNLVVHAVNVVLVFLLLRMLVKRTTPAALGAAIFAVHPLQVESVAWISELRGLLCGLFCLLSLIAYVRASDGGDSPREGFPRPAGYIASVLLFGVALLCKPAAASMAIAIFCLRAGWLKAPWQQAFKDALPYVLLALPIAIISNKIQGHPKGVDTAIWLRLFVAGDALAFYIGKLLAPIHLAIDYGRKTTVVASHWWGYATWIVPVAVGLMAAACRKSFPAAWIGLAIAASFLLPVLGLTPFTYQGYSTVADRYIYMAMLGIALIVAAAVARLETTSLKAETYTAAGAVIAILTVISFIHVPVWRNSVTLYTAALRANPRAYSAPTNLGAYYITVHDYAAAIPPLEQAVKNDSTDYMSMANLGDAYQFLGRTADAEKMYRQAIAVHSTDTHSLFGLALIESSQGHTSDAIEDCEQAIDADPTLNPARALLGGLYMQTHQYYMALTTYQNGLTVSRSWSVNWLDGIAQASMRLGRPADAVAALQTAITDGQDPRAVATFLAQAEKAAQGQSASPSLH